MSDQQGITFDGEEVAASFKADIEKRTITGLMVPWGKVARAGFEKWKFYSGSLYWSATRRVKMNLGHERKETVGVGIRIEDSPVGLHGSFRVAQGPEGDRALQLAQEGILDGFSVEVDFDDGDSWVDDPDEDGVRVVKRAALKGVALTGYPAFDDARVERIAAARNEGDKMEQDTQDEKVIAEEDDTAAKFDQRISELQERVVASQADLAQQFAESVNAGLRTTLESMGKPQDGPDTVRAARYSTLKEPPVYRFDGSGHSLVRDAWASARSNDDDATDRIRRFRKQSEDMAEVVHSSIHFAPQTTSTASQIIPPGYRPDLYVSDLFRQRPLVNLASQGTIANATPFTVPTFTSVTTGSATHVEGTNPSDGSLAFGTKTITPQAISGRIVLSRELVDSSNPAIDQIAFQEMRESYTRQTEAIVYTLLNGTGGAGGVITAGFVPSGAQASTTAKGTDNQTLVKHLRTRIVDYPFARFDSPTGAVLGQAAAGLLAAAVDTTQRPLFTFAGQSNSFGGGAATSGQWLVDNQLAIAAAWVMTGVAAGDSQILLVNRSDLWVWESPLLTFRFEEKQGPANIELNIFGYFATHLLRPVGLSGIRIT